MDRKKTFVLCALLLLLFIGALWTLLAGPTPFSDVWSGVQKRISGLDNSWNPLLDERLPRLITILCTGASLATAGTVMQTLFRNPLASPSVLGLPAGAALCVLFCFLLNIQHLYPWMLSLSAFCGCFFTLLFIYSVSRLFSLNDMNALVLTSIALATVLTASLQTILYALRANWNLVQSMSEWMVGATVDRNWQHVHMQVPLTIYGLLGCYSYRHELNILCLGDEEASNLGIDVPKVRWHLFIWVSMLVSGAVAAMGNIAFFGLILPNILRTILGPNIRTLIPFSIFVGAATLLYLDIFLRFFQVTVLSIGNIFALLGGVYFLVVLIQYQQQRKGLVVC